MFIDWGIIANWIFKKRYTLECKEGLSGPDVLCGSDICCQPIETNSQVEVLIATLVGNFIVVYNVGKTLFSFLLKTLKEREKHTIIKERSLWNGKVYVKKKLHCFKFYLEKVKIFFFWKQKILSHTKSLVIEKIVYWGFPVQKIFSGSLWISQVELVIVILLV